MLRCADKNDSLAMGRVYCEAWKAAYRGMMPDSFLDSLTDADCAPPPERISPGNTLVWEEDGAIRGLVNFGPGRDADSEGMAEIRSVYVYPSCWQQGVGGKLMRGAVDVLRRLGYARVFLWTLEENTRARRFYEKQGMVMTGTRTIEIAGANLAECRYEMNI